MSGCLEGGKGLPMKVRIGAIHITTTTTKVGPTMRVIGTTKITTTIMTRTTTAIAMMTAIDVQSGPAEVAGPTRGAENCADALDQGTTFVVP
jgi:hypothetical protein